MTGGLFEDEGVRIPGRVGYALYQQYIPPPAPNIINNPPPLPPPITDQTEESAVLGHGGGDEGDGGDPWVLVLLGKERSGKSSTGNSIVGDTRAFEVERTRELEIVDKVIPSIEVPVKVIDTPGYGEDKDTNKENNEKLVYLLEQHIHLVHAFVAVVNAEDEDQRQTFEMIREHVEIFGSNFVANLVIVVTHWSMSEEANNARQMSGVSRENFTENWINELSQKIPLQSEEMIPFVFLDNQVQVGAPGASTFDETEQECFEASKCALFQHLSACPVFFCVGLQGEPPSGKISKIASSKGYKLCSKCNRYFVPVEEITLTEASRGLAGASQASVAAVRIARVARATARAWTPQSAMKAMTRGWHGRAGGLHLFGKLVSRAGLAVQVGFGVYRFINATNSTEKAKAAIGTGAGIIGGWGGATWGASVGTFLLPGIGTILGGIVGGVAGAIGLQAASERCVELFAPDVCFSCKKYEEAQC